MIVLILPSQYRTFKRCLKNVFKRSWCLKGISNMSKRHCVVTLCTSIIKSSFVYCIIYKKRYLNYLSANDEYTCHPKWWKVTSMFKKHEICYKMVYVKKEQHQVGQETQESRHRNGFYICNSYIIIVHG